MVQATGIISVIPPFDYGGGVGGILIPPTLIPFGVRARSTGFGAAGADTRPEYECGAAGARKILQIEQRAGIIYAIGTRDHCAVGLREPWCVWYVRVAPGRSLQLGTNSDTFPSPG